MSDESDPDPIWAELWRYAMADRARFWRLVSLLVVAVLVAFIWFLVFAALGRSL